MRLESVQYESVRQMTPPLGTCLRRLRWVGLTMVAAFGASAALAAPADTLGQPSLSALTVIATAPSPALEPTAAFNREASPQYDPWQGVNRQAFAIGMSLDRHIVGPIAHGYVRVTPMPIRHRIGAAAYNLGEPGTALNDVFQGHAGRAATTASRFVINSTVGLLGLFDVAAGLGLEGHYSDFGQTLGRYGAHPGPFVYIPVVGPLDLRDGIGRIVDLLTDPVALIAGGVTTPFGASRSGLTVLDRRATGDGAFKALDDATDPYATTRSAYMQRREFLVRDASGQTAMLPDFDAAPAKP